MEAVITCPLGSQCEEIKDNKLHRCAWYTQVAGTNPNTGEEVNDWACAMSWMPILMVENAQTNRGQTAAMESFRNEMVKDNDKFLSLAQQQTDVRLIKDASS